MEYSSIERQEQVQLLLASLLQDDPPAFERRLDDTVATADLPRDAWLVLCAERSLLSSHSRRSLLDRLLVAIGALELDGHPVWAMRGAAVAAQALIAEGEYEAATGCIDRLDALMADPKHRLDLRALPLYVATSRLLRAQIHLHGDDPAHAAAILDDLASRLDQRSLADPAFQVAVLSLRVVAWAAVGGLDRLEAAVNDLHQRQGAASALTHYQRGVIADTGGRTDEAIRHFQATIELEPLAIWTSSAHFALARLQPELAAFHIDAALAATHAGDTALQVTLARAALKAGRGTEARARAEAIGTSCAGLLIQAEVYAAAGPPRLARQRASALLAAATERCLPALQGQAHLVLARMEPDLEQRLYHLSMARGFALATNNALSLARVRVEQAWLEVAAGDTEGALESATILEQCAATQRRGDLAAAASLVRGLIRFDGADEYLERARELARRSGVLSIETRALEALGRMDEARTLRAAAGYVDA